METASRTSELDANQYVPFLILRVWKTVVAFDKLQVGLRG